MLRHEPLCEFAFCHRLKGVTGAGVHRKVRRDLRGHQSIRIGNVLVAKEIERAKAKAERAERVRLRKKEIEDAERETQAAERIKMLHAADKSRGASQSGEECVPPVGRSLMPREEEEEEAKTADPKREKMGIKRISRLMGSMRGK